MCPVKIFIIGSIIAILYRFVTWLQTVDTLDMFIDGLLDSIWCFVPHYIEVVTRQDLSSFMLIGSSIGVIVILYLLWVGIIPKIINNLDPNIKFYKVIRLFLRILNSVYLKLFLILFILIILDLVIY